MLVEHYREKLINAILYFLRNTKSCGKTKLLKLLYFLDFMHFRETGKSVTGLEYYAWDFGPVPIELYSELGNPAPDLNDAIFLPPEIGGREFVDLRAKKPINPKFFTKRELRILEEVAYIFKTAKAEEIVEASHLPTHPWDRTVRTKGYGGKIDYMLALDNTNKSLPSEEVEERIKDRENIKRAFGE